jgi:hypothetical protein
MYVGVLTGVWATPWMTYGHALLGLGLTGYVLIAMRYEERDLLARFGAPYGRWRQRPARMKRMEWHGPGAKDQEALDETRMLVPGWPSACRLGSPPPRRRSTGR